MIRGTFGEPVTIRLRRWHHGAATLATVLMLHRDWPKHLGVLIEGTAVFVPIRACRPWACPTCTGTTVWWRLGLGEIPVCARCVRMPREVYLQLWEEAHAHALAVELNAGEPGDDYRAYVVAVVEQAVANGDISPLLQFATCRYLLRTVTGSEGVSA